MKVENLEIPSHIKEDYLETGITELNPPQEKAVKAGLLEQQDMIVAAPTASGKTFIAELAMVEQVIKNKGTAVYIVPLKALASEKYEDFKDRYNDQDVKISVGDMDDDGEYLDTADIVVTTSEKLDSMLRHNPSWIHDIGLVVVDEIHLLTSQSRGPTLEVTITRLRELLDFQMLGLSATISNSDEMAEWLNAELVKSDYRPVELEEAVYEGQKLEFFDEDPEKEEKSENSDSKIGAEKKEGSDINSAFQTGTEIAEEDNSEDRYQPVRSQKIPDKHSSKVQNILADTFEQDKQGIVFCSSRKGAEKSSDRVAKVTEEDLTREEKSKLDEYAEIIENVLGSPTEQCKRLAENMRKGSAFHHAGLLNRQRQVVEEAFRKGYIKSICATPTLAAGVNLPAFRVIIRDLKRYTGNGMEFIPVLEYEQISGRAGRPKYDNRGEAISIAKNPGMTTEIVDRYIAGEAERIQSKLAVEPVLRMHTLALIASNFCNTRKELQDFYSKTFYAHQYSDIGSVEEKINKVVGQLREYGFLKDDKFEATPLGRRVSELYIDPDSAHLILESLEKAEEKETKPISYLFMLCHTSELQPRMNVNQKEEQDYAQALDDAAEYILEQVPKEWDVEYEMFLEVMKTAMMLNAWIDESDEQEIVDRFNTAPGGIRSKVSNADWLLYASKELARMEDLGADDIEKLRVRLKHGIREELLSLVQYDQIGRVRARKLYDYGIRDADDIRETEFEKLKKLIGKKTGKKLKKQVGQENIFDRENIMDYF